MCRIDKNTHYCDIILGNTTLNERDVANMQCAHCRHKTYLLSFVSAVLYGWILDGWLWGLSLTGAWSIPVRLICMLIGFCISSLGVAFFFKTYLAPGAYELFVKEIARRYRLNMNKFKIVYDLTSCAVAIVLALVAFGSIFDRGIGIGTVLVALLNGLSIAFFSKLLDKTFTFFDRFPWAKHFEGE